MHTEPWNLNSKLTKEHISLIANLIKQVRAEVIELHDETNLGDTALSLGMRCYEVSKERIKRKSLELDFLSILTPSGRFTMGINGVPVRFVRKNPSRLESKKLISSPEAIGQMDLLKEFCPEYAELRWFFVFDTYYKSPADDVYFVGYSESGEIICQYEILLEDKVTLFSFTNPQKAEAVKQQKPQVTLKPQFKADKKDNGK